MPRYDYRCAECAATHEATRPIAQAADPSPCPVCGQPAPRAMTMARLLFKADPRDNRPVWHNHDGYSHQHAPRRGRHATPDEDH